MSEQQIVLRDDGLAKLTLQAPAEVIKKAGEAAQVLMDMVNKQGLSKKFGGDKAHLEYEAWATVSRFYGCTIRCPDESAKPIGDLDNGRYAGFKAHADILNSNGDVIGGADAYCMRDEPNWEKKPNFQLASMAQTRAGSKAARMIFSWVAVLAGFSPTPAEEVVPESGGSSVNDSPTITEKQAKRLFAIAKSKGIDETLLQRIVANYGYKRSLDINMSDYDKIVKEVEESN